MKIAFISQGLGHIKPPEVSGSISIWTYEVMSQLRKTENIIAYEMGGGKLSSQKVAYKGIQYFYAPTLLNKIINSSLQKIASISKKLRVPVYSLRKPVFASFFHNIAYIFWVSINLRNQKCHIIHIHQFSQFIKVIRFFNPKSKIVLHMSCEWLTQLDTNLMRKRISKVDLIFGCSDYITVKIAKKFPEFTGKIKTVYNGVDQTQFTLPHKDFNGMIEYQPNLLFVGRVSPEKGIHLLIGAMRRLAGKYPKVHLNIVGPIHSVPQNFIVDLDENPAVMALSRFYNDNNRNEDYYYTCLKKMIDNDIRKHITFCGRKTHEKVAEYYRAADIILNPSLSESFGMSLTEAMASGKPTISSRVGGMVNVVVDGETGILVDPDDIDLLANAVIFLTDHPDIMKKMGASGRIRVVKQFSWEKVANSALNEYLRIIE